LARWRFASSSSSSSSSSPPTQLRTVPARSKPRSHVFVSNVPDCSRDEVADHAFALRVALARRRRGVRHATAGDGSGI
jgi:phosphoglycerate dehydrogenase-like enzyme